MIDPFSAQTNDVPGSWVWRGSLALFCVAAATGALFRFKVAYGGAGTLSLGHIRHAHSHLMYMGWVTPVQMGPVRMPVAAAASGLNILCWYAFVGLYAVGTWGLVRTGPLRVWDVALSFLTVSTLGAWGVGVLHGLDLYDPIWTTAAIHFYLDLFSEGWLVMGVLGVVIGVVGEEGRSWTRPLWLVACGLPVSFLLALPSMHLSGAVELVGRLGAGFVGLGLLLFVGRLSRRAGGRDPGWMWGLPLLTLGVKAAGQLVVALVPVLWPGDHDGLRIFYLHLMLLGFVSMGIVAGARVVWRGASVRGTAIFYGAVGLLLGSLGVLVWPAGGFAQQLAAWVTLLPLLTAMGLFVKSGVQAREENVSAEQ